MCTSTATTERNVTPNDFVGLPCPLSEDGSALRFMRFLDPHGVERVDQQLLESTNRRNVFVVGEGRIRLLASDGARPKPARWFAISAGKLTEVQ